MRASINLSLLTLLTAAGMFSCGLEPLSGGSGTETINTYACLSDGSPAQGALVQVINELGWMSSIRQGISPVIERAVADSNGLIKLTVLKNIHAFNIQIDHSQQGAFISGADSVIRDGDTIHLKPNASFTGSFSGEPNRITRMFLSGSAYNVSIGSTGDFYFDKVAPASFAILGSTGLQDTIVVGGTITLAPGSTIVDTMLNATIDRLLIDNFEGGVGPTALGQVIPAIAWYAVSDSGLWAWSKSRNEFYWTNFTWQPVGGTFVKLAPVPGDIGGTAMAFTAVLNNEITNYYAVSGLSFRGLNENGINLSAMTGFSLRCKGHGTIWVRFTSYRLDSASSTQGIAYYAYPITLNETMTLYPISVNSLQILPVNTISTQQYPWTVESHNIKTVEFEFAPSANAVGDTLRFMVDDFYLDGVRLEAFAQ